MERLASFPVQKLLIPVLLFALFGAAMAFRPLLPIDETRYMSAAWEMYLRHDWLSPLTVNFQPYHHKPPLLFWLINASWSVFGVSRWAGALPMAIASGLCLYLTKILAEKLFPEQTAQTQNIPLLMIGSISFLIYGNLVMFDITLTVFVLLSFIALVSYARSGKALCIVVMALTIGLGVLTKGPVMWLYIIFPMLLGPLWIENALPKLKWYGGCFVTLALSIIPVLFWLIPVLQASSNDFAFWLIWEQTAGRITGDFSASHVRPVYFYMMFAPVLFLPWVIFPSFWKGLSSLKNHLPQESGLRFILWWIVPVFIAFSLISGKQPHYMVPLLPGVIILIAMSAQISPRKIVITALSLVSIFIVGQGLASLTIFKKYDLQPIANYVHAHADDDWVFIKKYHGELTFLARMKKPIDTRYLHTMKNWFDTHSNGLAIIRYSKTDPIDNYQKIFDMPYRGKQMAILKRFEKDEDN